MKTIEEIYEDYKKEHKFTYTDHDGIDKYDYCGKIALSLEEIHRCETDYMTKACVISDGHICKDLRILDSSSWVIEKEDDKYMKIVSKKKMVLEGYKCNDPFEIPHLYCTKLF